MDAWLLALGVLYLVVGILVYAVTDTTEAAARLESRLIVVPYGVVLEYVFLFVILLWPLWLSSRPAAPGPPARS